MEQGFTVSSRTLLSWTNINVIATVSNDQNHFWNILHELWVFSFAHVPWASMSCTRASHQGAIQLFWLHFEGALISAILYPANGRNQVPRCSCPAPLAQALCLRLVCAAHQWSRHKRLNCFIVYYEKTLNMSADTLFIMWWPRLSLWQSHGQSDSHICSWYVPDTRHLG